MHFYFDPLRGRAPRWNDIVKKRKLEKILYFLEFSKSFCFYIESNFIIYMRPYEFHTRQLLVPYLTWERVPAATGSRGLFDVPTDAIPLDWFVTTYIARPTFNLTYIEKEKSVRFWKGVNLDNGAKTKSGLLLRIFNWMIRWSIE